MGNKQANVTKRHESSQQTVRESQSHAHSQAMAQISLEQSRIEARAREAETAMKAEKNRLEAEAKQAELQMQKEQQEREDALKEQEMINKENDKEKKREQRQAAIDDITTKLTTIPEKINMEREKLKMVKAEFGDTTEKLNEIELKLNNWDQFKEQHLIVFKLNLKNAKHDYERDDKAIKDAVNSTGVHEENVNRFLLYTHNLINATVSTTHATNKLQTKISTFGELISRLCQTKLSIEGYFTDVMPKLKPFIPILSVKGFTYMDELKCKSTDEFEKDIFPMLEKGIVQQKTKDNIAETNEEKKQEPVAEKSFKELLTEWKLAKYIDKFEEEGWDDPRDYKDMEVDDLKKLGLNKPAIKKFARGFKKWSQGAAEEDELIGLVQKRQLKSICLESAETWEKDAKMKQKEVKKGLMVASPLLGGFFGTIDVAVKEAQNMLEYNDALNENQVAAIEMIKEDEKKDDSKSERVIRENWDAQSKCEIFSDSAQKWYDGTIIKITNDKEGEWLNIAYRTGDDEKTPTLKQIQRFAKDIKPKEDKIDAVEQKNDELMKVQKNCSALTKAAIIQFHIVEELKAECLGDSVKLMALDVADGVEKGCVQIFKSAGTIRKSVFLAQSILQLKPANMDDKTRKQLWSAVDNGIINIYKTALEVAKVSEKYFNYFVKFKQSFGYFMQCYKGKNEKEQEEMTLMVSMEYLTKDIREFDAFQQNFIKTVTDLEAKSLNVIAECVKTTIGAEEFEKARNSRQKTKETYLERQKEYDDELATLNQQLDKYWDEKIELAPKHSSLEYQSKMLSKSLEQNEIYVKELERRLEDIQKIQI